MAFHGCLCTECDQLYGYVGTYPNGDKVVCGKCSDGWNRVRTIETFLEAQSRIRDRGEEVTSDNLVDEVSQIHWEREQKAKERYERAELNRLERKYRRKGRKS